MYVSQLVYMYAVIMPLQGRTSVYAAKSHGVHMIVQCLCSADNMHVDLSGENNEQAVFFCKVTVLLRKAVFMVLQSASWLNYKYKRV